MEKTVKSLFVSHFDVTIAKHVKKRNHEDPQICEFYEEITILAQEIYQQRLIRIH